MFTRKRIAAVAAAVALGGTSWGFATAASAATAGRSPAKAANVRVIRHAGGPATVIIDTNSYAHMDTTNVSGTATLSSPNGPVWAIDKLKERWTVTTCAANPACDSTDGANYFVTLTTQKGSRFAGFANPGPEDSADGITSTCNPANAGGSLMETGTLSGTISYSVVSDASPDLSSVPATEPPDTGLGAVLSQIFDNASNFATVGATPYDFKYSQVCGSVYEQAG